MHIIYSKKVLIILFFVLFGAFSSFSQGWFRSYGGTGTETTAGVVVSGNDYIHAATTSSYGAGQTDIMVIKTDSMGKLIWQQVIGTPSDEKAKGIVCSPTGEIYICGDVYTNGTRDILLVKMDTLGQLIWMKTFPGTINMHEVATAIAFSDSCLAISCNINPTNATNFVDIKIMGVDTAGNELWSKTFGAPTNYDIVNGIAPVHDGGFIIGCMLQVYPNTFGFMARLSHSGDTIWTKTLQYYQNLNIQSCTELKGDSLFAFGATSYTIVLRMNGDIKILAYTGYSSTTGITSCEDGGFALISPNSAIIKYSSDGIVQWLTSIFYRRPFYLKQSPDHGFIISGNDELGLDPDNLLMLKTDNLGNCNTFSAITPMVLGNSYPYCQSDTVTFKVPTGFDSYQWYSTDGTGSGMIVGETDSILLITGNRTYYNFFCKMTLGNEIIYSKIASATFNTTWVPEISPAGTLNFCASSTTKTLSFNRANYHYYQWHLNGVPIPGAIGDDYNPTISGVYTVSVHRNCDTLFSEPVTVNVNAPPVATLNTTNSYTIVLAGGGGNPCYNASPYSVPNQSGHSYSWIFNNSPVGNNTNYLIPYLPGIYQVIVSNSCGLDTSNAGNHTIYTQNFDIMSFGQLTGCGADTAVLRLNYWEINSFQWLNNGIPIPGATLDSLVITTGGQYSCEIVVGCDFWPQTVMSNTIAFSPNLNILPSISSTGNAVVCSGTVLLNASVSGAVYQWYKNSSLIANANAQSYLADTTGSYYCKITTPGCGTINSNIIHVKIGAPSGIIYSNNSNICQGNSAHLNFQTGDPAQTFTTQWRKDGIAIQGANNINYSATVQGVYDCLMINLCDTTITNSITVNVVSVSVNPGGNVNVCSGDSILLSATTGAGYTYTWYSGNSIISGANTSAYYANTGGYYKVLINTGTCYIYSPTVIVSVVSPPEANIWSSTYPALCSNDSVWLHANNRPDYIHQWYFDNQPISNNSPDLYAHVAGNYKVFILDSLGCSKTSPDFNVNNNTLSGFPILLTPSIPFCEGDTVEMASGLVGSSYQWLYNNLPIPGAVSATYITGQSGMFSLEVNDSVGCTGISSQLINLISPPAPSLHSSPSYCGNNTGMISTSLSQHSFYPYTYLWSNGDTTHTIYNLSGGTYTLTMTNSAGCVVVDSAIVAVNSSLNINASTANDTICMGDSTSIYVSGPASNSYIWNTGDTTQGIVAIATGLYIVTVTDTTGCSGSDTVSVTVNPLPIINLTTSGPVIFCQGDSVVLDAGPGFTSYSWLRTGTNILPAQTAQTYTAKIAGKYACIATNIYGCVDTSGIIMVRVPCVPIGPPIDKIHSTEGNLSDFIMFPNPAKDFLNIHFFNKSEVSSNVLLTITDAKGKLIFSQSTISINGENNYEINIKSFSPGMYFLSLNTTENQICRKFIVD